MDRRSHVKVEGIPVVWKETNLTDDDLRDFYSMMSNDPDFVAAELPPESTTPNDLHRIRIDIFMKIYEFKDGLCLCVGCKGQFSALHKTKAEFEVWVARGEEEAELRDEQERELQAEEVLFLVEDAHLKQKVKEGLESGNYNTVINLLDRRVELRERNKHLRTCFSESSTFEYAFRTFILFPDADGGIGYLNSHADKASWYVYFAQKYFFGRSSTDNRLVEEVEKIFYTALARFPNSGWLFRRICLFWAFDRLDLAIQYCKLAIDRKLSDGTKSGFAGRLKRLQKELHAQSQHKR